MPKTVHYRQCRLRNGSRHMTSWLPDRFARKGAVLKLRNHEGEWDNGWLVEDAGDRLLPEELLPDSHEAIKRHRKASGDAEPRLA